MKTHTIQVNQPIIAIQYKRTSLPAVLSHSTHLSNTHVFSGEPDDMADQVMILENALQTSREESFQVGYEEGKEAGLFEMRHKLDDLAEESKALVSSLQNEYDKALIRMEAPLVKLSIRIAERILGSELMKEESMIEFLSGKVKDMLKDIKGQSRITIHVNPDRLAWVSDENITADLNISTGGAVNFVGDDHLLPGECLLETDQFIVDNTFRHQLEMLEQQMLEESGKWIY